MDGAGDYSQWLETTSVTRLGDFLKFVATSFLTKVALKRLVPFGLL